MFEFATSASSGTPVTTVSATIFGTSHCFVSVGIAVSTRAIQAALSPASVSITVLTSVAVPVFVIPFMATSVVLVLSILPRLSDRAVGRRFEEGFNVKS